MGSARTAVVNWYVRYGNKPCDHDSIYWERWGGGGGGWTITSHHGQCTCTASICVSFSATIESSSIIIPISSLSPTGL